MRLSVYSNKMRRSADGETDLSRPLSCYCVLAKLNLLIERLLFGGHVRPWPPVVSV